MALTKLKLSKLFVRLQVLDLKRLKLSLMVLRRLLKRAHPKLRLRTSKLNLRLRELRLHLNNPIRSEVLKAVVTAGLPAAQQPFLVKKSRVNLAF